MGLFDKFKSKKEKVDWSNAYKAMPKFYSKPDGSPFGAVALTEGTETILLKNPQLQYKVDGNSISDWKMVFVSTSKDSIIGDADYFTALKKAEKYAIDSNENSVLIKGLSLAELESLIG
ncbi:MAG: DUF4299 family protein [Eubacterium sp.]|nr:DUF4299 family protein [Eubacterium sp.]